MEGARDSMHPDDKELILHTAVKASGRPDLAVITWRTDMAGYFIEVHGACGRDGQQDTVIISNDDPCPGATIRAHHNRWVTKVADEIPGSIYGTIVFPGLSEANHRAGGSRWFQARSQQ